MGRSTCTCSMDCAPGSASVSGGARAHGTRNSKTGLASRGAVRDDIGKGGRRYRQRKRATQSEKSLQATVR
jgi:hypothetical protein